MNRLQPIFHIASWIALSAFLGGCAASMEKREATRRLVENPVLPVEVGGTSYPQSRLALIEITAPDFGAWIVGIDGTSVARFNEVTPDSVFLNPGSHTFTIVFRNLNGLTIREGDADVQMILEAGHTYMPHNYGFNSGSMSASNKITLGMLDYGESFPRGCLAGQIVKHNKAQVATFAVRQAMYAECIRVNGYQDKYEYLSPDSYR